MGASKKKVIILLTYRFVSFTISDVFFILSLPSLQGGSCGKVGNAMRMCKGQPKRKVPLPRPVQSSSASKFKKHGTAIFVMIAIVFTECFFYTYDIYLNHTNRQVGGKTVIQMLFYMVIK